MGWQEYWEKQRKIDHEFKRRRDEFLSMPSEELLRKAKSEGEKSDMVIAYELQRWFVVDGWVQVGGDSASLQLIGVALQRNPTDDENPAKLLWTEIEIDGIQGHDVYIDIDKKSLVWDSTRDPRVYPAPLGSYGEWKVVPCEVDPLYVKYLIAVNNLRHFAFQDNFYNWGVFAPIVDLLRLLYKHYRRSSPS